MFMPSPCWSYTTGWLLLLKVFSPAADPHCRSRVCCSPVFPRFRYICSALGDSAHPALRHQSHLRKVLANANTGWPLRSSRSKRLSARRAAIYSLSGHSDWQVPDVKNRRNVASTSRLGANCGLYDDRIYLPGGTGGEMRQGRPNRRRTLFYRK